MDVARLKALIDLVSSSPLSELNLTNGGERVRVKKHLFWAVPDGTVRGKIAEEGDSAIAVQPSSRGTVRAPVSGMFFASPSPFSPPFYQLGDQIKAGSTLCVIEAMKTLTSVVCEHSGTLKAVLTENGTFVEFEQPLFEIV